MNAVFPRGGSVYIDVKSTSLALKLQAMNIGSH